MRRSHRGAAFAITALGLLIAARIREMEGFQVVMQFLTMPMFFLSGALFPLSGLPGWLSVLTRLDPLTYAVDPMRRAVFAEVGAPPEITSTLNPGVVWGSWQVPVLVELGVVAAFAALALSVAMLTFQRSD
ncbi:MAG: ABC transporter permease [Dehalococcoidia bacterium]